MSKLAFPLSLLALALAAYAAFAPRDASSGATTTAQAPTDRAALQAIGREITTRARAESRAEIQRHLADFDQRFDRLDVLRGEMAESLIDVGDWIEETKKLSAGGLDGIKKQLAGMSEMPSRLRAMAMELEAFEARVKAVEDRPEVVREVIREVASANAKPDRPQRPTLPGRATESAETIRKKVAKAMVDLSSDEPGVLFSAIEVTRKYKVLESAPRLIQILEKHKNTTIRQNAAVALGAMQSCDAVLPLAKAVASDGELAQMASRAVLAITGFDAALSHSARTKERRKASNAILAFWRAEEATVRGRLGQPAGS